MRPGDGDLWTFTAIDADTRLMVSWLVGPRNIENAITFMKDIRARVTQRIQLTTGGHTHYEVAVREAFRWNEVHWSMLVKEYGTVGPHKVDAAHRYSPPVCTGALKLRKIGNPDPDLISTSYVERSNLTIRVQNRRFTRLTNAFSKKAENHAHAVSLFFMYYNYCRPHQSLGRKTTPAMAAGLADGVWTVEDILPSHGPDLRQDRIA